MNNSLVIDWEGYRQLHEDDDRSDAWKIPSDRSDVSLLENHAKLIDGALYWSISVDSLNMYIPDQFIGFRHSPKVEGDAMLSGTISFSDFNLLTGKPEYLDLSTVKMEDLQIIKQVYIDHEAILRKTRITCDTGYVTWFLNQESDMRKIQDNINRIIILRGIYQVIIDKAPELLQKPAGMIVTLKDINPVTGNITLVDLSSFTVEEIDEMIQKWQYFKGSVSSADSASGPGAANANGRFFNLLNQYANTAIKNLEDLKYRKIVSLKLRFS